MGNQIKDDTVKRSHLIIIIVCLSLVLVLGVLAVVSLLLPEKPMASKDEIRQNIEDFDTSSKNHNYVCVYLEKLGIRGFDTRKFKSCEKLFADESIYEIKSKGELAVKTAELFLEYYYDEIDLKNKVAVTDALLTCYVEAFGDHYAIYRTKSSYEDYKDDMSGEFGGIGITVSYNNETKTMTVETVLQGSGAEEAGILVGDLIIGAQGKSLEEVGYSGIVSLIRGKIGETVEVTLSRNGEIITAYPIRKKVVDQTVTFKMLESNIGYIRITAFKDNTPDQFREVIDTLTEMGARGLIFDLRNNPGGYLRSVADTLDYLIPDGHLIASYTDSKDTYVYTSGDGHSVDLPMCVVFNGNTASGGELFSAAIRDYADMGIINAISVGQTTFGKGILQSTRYFSDGSTVTLTVAYYNPPSDVNYHDIGVEPDFEVADAQGTDAKLAAAYTEILNLIENK